MILMFKIVRERIRKGEQYLLISVTDHHGRIKI